VGRNGLPTPDADSLHRRPGNGVDVNYEYIYIPHKLIKSPEDLYDALNKAGTDGFQLMPELAHHQNAHWFVRAFTPEPIVTKPKANPSKQEAQRKRAQEVQAGKVTKEAETDEV